MAEALDREGNRDLGECAFVAYACSSYELFLAGQCTDCGPSGTGCAVVGLSSIACRPREGPVKMYFKTNQQSPFCLRGPRCSSHDCRIVAAITAGNRGACSTAGDRAIERTDPASQRVPGDLGSSVRHTSSDDWLSSRTLAEPPTIRFADASVDRRLGPSLPRSVKTKHSTSSAPFDVFWPEQSKGTNQAVGREPWLLRGTTAVAALGARRWASRQQRGTRDIFAPTAVWRYVHSVTALFNPIHNFMPARRTTNVSTQFRVSLTLR
ncbi:hypothetical protein V5799_028687 [Amblyomma americanum]|uniref:Uncharacterized protein n=1 Tax=Amblyomma americanum TaxID=6943 RepID=A0AAQ4DC57_AMBAM